MEHRGVNTTETSFIMEEQGTFATDSSVYNTADTTIYNKTDYSVFNTTYVGDNSTITSLSPGVLQKQHDVYVDIINEAMFERIVLPSMVYLIVLMSIGLPGNMLVCYIYHKQEENKSIGTGRPTQKMKSSDIFILALAWLDILHCILSVSVEIYLLRYFVKFDHPWICKISRYSSMVLNAASTLVLLGIAIDRFIGIKYSQSKYRFTAKTAIKFVVVSVIIAIIISLPGILLYGTLTLQIKAKPDIYGKTCLIEDRFVKTKYPLILTMFLLTMHLVFDLVFIILYSIIGKKVIRSRNLSSFRTSKEKRKSQSKTSAIVDVAQVSFTMSSRKILQTKSFDNNGNIELQGYRYNISTDDKSCENQQLAMNGKTKIQSSSTTVNKKEHAKTQKESAVHGNVYKAGKTTFMLFTVTIVYIVTFSPYCAIAILRNATANDFYSNLSDTEKAIYQLFLRSYLLSSAANPIVYSFLSDKFRRQCRNLFNRIFRC